MSGLLEETVTCRVCGHVGKSLARHLKAAHGITAGEYRAEYGADALIRSPAAEARRRAGLRKAHKPRKPKQVSCTQCGETTEIPNQASASLCFRVTLGRFQRTASNPLPGCCVRSPGRLAIQG